MKRLLSLLILAIIFSTCRPPKPCPPCPPADTVKVIVIKPCPPCPPAETIKVIVIKPCPPCPPADTVKIVVIKEVPYPVHDTIYKTDTIYIIDTVCPPDVVLPPTAKDSVHYLLSENFDSATSDIFKSYDNFAKFWEYNSGGFNFNNQSIVEIPGRGNVWHAKISSYTQAPNDCWHSFDIELPFGVNVSDCWASAWVFVPKDFDPFGVGNDGGTPPAHKINATGFYGTNDGNLSPNPLDITTPRGRGVWGHPVGTGDRKPNGDSRGLNYLYFQGIWNYSTNREINWTNGFNSGDSGFYQENVGKWVNMKGHIVVGDPDKYNGYYEIYIDNILVGRISGFKCHSKSQGQFGYIEGGSMSFFLGGSQTLVYASRKENWMDIDKVMWYYFLPGSANFNHKMRNIGDRAPDVPFPDKNVRPPKVLTDEKFTADADTIYDCGKPYIYNPPSITGFVTKTIELSSGSGIDVNFNVLYHEPEWGYPPDVPNQSYWVKLYQGTGANKVLLHTFGRTDAGYENPGATWWHVNGRAATLEYHTGTRSGATRGVCNAYRKTN